MANVNVDALRNYTAREAEKTRAQLVKITAIDGGLRELLGQVKDDVLKKRLEEKRAALGEVIARLKAIAETIANIGAHPEQPLPPPVEPETVPPEATQLPAEPPPTPAPK